MKPDVACVCVVSIFAILCVVAVGIYHYESNVDYSPQYEVELSDGTVYQCRYADCTLEGKTMLYHVDGIKDNNVSVFTHLIVRCTPL